MSKRKRSLSLLYIILIGSLNIFSTQPSQDPNEQFVNIQFHGKSLRDVIMQITKLKRINILFPPGDTTSDITINFSTPHEIPLIEAEEILLSLLSMSGYMLTLQGNVFVVNKKTDISTTKSTLPVYINVDPSQLPDNNQYIRAVYFLKNIKAASNMALSRILFDILPEKSVMVDEKSNSLLMVGPAQCISAAMTIIHELDTHGIRDEVKIIPLFNTSAPVITRLLEEIIPMSKDMQAGQQGQGNIQTLHSGGAYFSPYVKIIPENRTNSLIMIGKIAAINKIVDFIREELDTPPSSGKNIVHVYNLKHLDAQKIAPILQSIVSGKSEESQSVQEQGSSGIYKNFDGVRILAEEITQAETQGSAAKGQSRLTLGGNRLIIAATSDDYKEVIKIIEKLDKPQSQIIVEAMILNLDSDEVGSLSSQLRLPGFMTPPNGVGAQSIMLDNSLGIVTNPSMPNVQAGATIGEGGANPLSAQATINSDILALNSSGASIADGRSGTIITLGEEFKNMGIASILQIQNSKTMQDVVANPYVITENNTRTEIKRLITRRGRGKISADSNQYGGASVIDVDSYSAALSIGITPRINNIQHYNESDKPQMSIELEVLIEEFKTNQADNFDKIVRSIKTSANIGSGDLFVLGGLYSENDAEVENKVPILGDIPLLGAFFRKTKIEKKRTNMIIVLRVTAAEAKSEVMDAYNNDKAHYTRTVFDEDRMFGNLKDPITRLYLGNNSQAEKIPNVGTDIKRPFVVEGIGDITDDEKYKKIQAHAKSYKNKSL